MIVITLTSCPPKLRGDLSKWLCEINTGVYVGNLSARVRDGLWERVCENLATGKATMVYSSSGEQHMEFRVHNSAWKPIDFDGITLMKRPLMEQTEEVSKSPYRSKAGNYYHSSMAKKYNKKQNQTGKQYIVIDIETTGLRCGEDEIIELAALKIIDRMPADSFTALIDTEKVLPGNIMKLTGITQEELEKDGLELSAALSEFLECIGNGKLIGYNISFDLSFIQNACKKCGKQMIANPTEDAIKLAKKKLDDVRDYKLETVSRSFGLEEQKHRALDDCYLIHRVYEKLKDFE